MPEVPSAPLAASLDRQAALDRFRHARIRTRAMFDLLDAGAYYDKPIALRNPIVFYEGHLPAFSVNTLLKKGLGEAGINPRFEVLFERGIDPEDESVAPGSLPAWPPRAEIQAYGREADLRIADAFERK